MSISYLEERVLESGNHLGFDWLVVHNGMGYRCGYIKLPSDHVWHGNDDCSDQLSSVDVHGGITFGQADDNGSDWWIGFDCCHSGDAVDHSLPGDHGYRMSLRHETIKDTTYCVKECKSLCEQASKAKGKYLA